MNYLLRIVALLLLSSLVFAQAPVGKVFTWTGPTEREDGTPLTEAEIDKYSIYCDGASAAIWTQSNTPGFEDRWESPAGTFALGDHNCYATAIDTGGRESSPSNTVPFSVTLANPKAPVFALP